MAKNELDLVSSVPDWLIERPQLLRTFKELGIDYSCGGKSLEFACRARDLEEQCVGHKHQRFYAVGIPCIILDPFKCVALVEVVLGR